MIGRKHPLKVLLASLLLAACCVSALVSAESLRQAVAEITTTVPMVRFAFAAITATKKGSIFLDNICISKLKDGHAPEKQKELPVPTINSVRVENIGLS